MYIERNELAERLAERDWLEATAPDLTSNLEEVWEGVTLLATLEVGKIPP